MLLIQLYLHEKAPQHMGRPPHYGEAESPPTSTLMFSGSWPDQSTFVDGFQRGADQH